jgi:hypothetical protein
MGSYKNKQNFISPHGTMTETLIVSASRIGSTVRTNAVLVFGRS